MARYKYKFNLIDNWRIGELESWYAEMASKGLILSKTGRMLSKFKKEKPQQLTYRIEVTPKKLIEDEHLHIIEDSGWDYVCSLEYFHVFCAPKSLNVPEIHSDPTEQAASLQPLYKTTKRNTIVATCIFIFMLAIVIYNCLFSEAALYFLFTGNSLVTYLPTLFLGWLIIDAWRGVSQIKQQIQRLQNGQAIEHPTTYKRRIWQFGLVILFAIVCYTIILFPFGRQTTISDVDNYPIVQLQSVETDATLHEAPELYNHTEKERQLLVSTIIESREAKRSTEYDPQTNTLYEPSITNDYYQLRFSPLSDAFYESLIEYSSYDINRSYYEELPHDYFDRVTIFEEDTFRQIFVQKNEHVLKVMYYGLATTAILLDEIEQAFQAQQL